MSPGVAFEVERLEVTGDDRLEVAGRWSGVRGVRFVRPSLIVRGDDGERSVLAVLDHKPWAPEEGESWIAAFPWAGGPVDPERAQLAVTPSIVVPLAIDQPAAPARASRARARRKPGEALREELEAERLRVRRLETEVAFLREQRELLTARAEEAESEGGRAAVDAAVAGAREAREQAEEVARVEREAALAEREAAAGERRELRRERDALERELEAARHERDAMRRARDEAFAERDAALVGRDAARAAARKATGAPPGPRVLGVPASSGPADWITRGLAVAAALCLLLLVIGLLRIL